MMKYVSRLAIGCTVISLLALAGCNTAKQASNPASPEAPAASDETKTAGAEASAGTETSALDSIVANTKTATEANDFAQASQTFEQFEESWEKVEDGIKAKSPESYSAIEDSAKQVENALKAKDKVKALEALQGLGENTAKVSQL
jgi:hypothetical protein